MQTISDAVNFLFNAYPVFGITRQECDSLDAYKFVSEQRFATGMLNGVFKIGTLSEYRNIENAKQGDKNEATHQYHANYQGKSGTPEWNYISSRTGIYAENVAEIKIENAVGVQKLEDAFIFCLSEHYNPDNFRDDFGEICVKINRIQVLYDLMSQVLQRHFPINGRAMGRVRYAQREYSGLQLEPGPLGFVKPPDEYASQSEIRFLWTMRRGVPIEPQIISIPYAAALCRLVIP